MVTSGVSRRFVVVSLAVVVCSVAIAVPAVADGAQLSASTHSADVAAPGQGPDAAGSGVPNESVQVTENVSLWNRAALSLRADADAAATVVPAPRTFVNHESLPQADLNRDRLAVFDPGTVPVRLSSADGADVSQFAGEEVQVLLVQGTLPSRGSLPSGETWDSVAPGDSSSDVDGGTPVPATTETRSGEPVEEILEGVARPASDGVSYEIDTAELDRDDGTLRYDLEADDAGVYAVVVATGQPFALDDGEPTRAGDSGTVIGAETVVVHERRSTVTAPDSATAGEAVSFDVETALSGERVDHAIALYHEETVLSSQMTLVLQNGALRGQPLGNVALETSIGAVDGVARVVGVAPDSRFGQPITGTFEPGALLRTAAAELDVPVEETVGTGSQRLDLSTTVVAGDDANVSIETPTLENASTGTYRYVHLATDRGSSGSFETSTGTIEVTPPGDGDDSDGGDGNDGDDSDDGEGNDGDDSDDGDENDGDENDGDDSDDGDVDGGDDDRVAPLCPPTPGLGQSSVTHSLSGTGAEGPIRLSISNVAAGARVCGTLPVGSGESTPDVAFRSLSFTAVQPLNFDAAVTRAQAPPEGVEPLPADADRLAFATVDHDAALNESVSDVELTARVARSRLAADGKEASDLQFWRYDGDEWTELEHRVVQSREERLVAVVESSGLSTFAASYADSSEGESPGSPGAEGPVVRTSSVSVEQETGRTGDPFLVTATVRSDAAESHEHVAELSVDGTTVERKSVTVAPDAATTVTFEHTFEEAGTYDLAVDGTPAGTVTVAAGETSVPEGDDGPGALAIGAAVAVLLLTALGVGYRYRNATSSD